MLPHLVIEKLACLADPLAVAGAFAHRRRPALLESSLPGGEYSRWSLYAADPVRTVTIEHDATGCPFDALAEAFAQYPQVAPLSIPRSLGCGWIGHIAYEAGLATERILPVPRAENALPLARFSLYDAVALHDARSNEWYAVVVEWEAGVCEDRPPVRERIAGIEKILNDAAAQPDIGSPLPTGSTVLDSSLSRAEYLHRVKKILNYIAAGDVYQVNLTQRFRAQTMLSPIDLYRRLRQISPSSHGAFLSYDDFSIISSSPELFLRSTDGTIVTRPIKGTRPRSCDPILDENFRANLASAEKDGAELAMIVDLVRNDLGRICDYGTVRVTEPASIEKHPTVYHRVATVEGQLDRSVSIAEILRATCPGGSVTGAPKIRAMQIISELESTPRGPYCGAIGWVGLDGSLSLNLAIRTMIQRGSTVDMHAGGGIVADSDPNDEYDEMMTKLSAMARALGCALPSVNTTRNLVGADS
jgi:para-aminobenzoate synthetase component I